MGRVAIEGRARKRDTGMKMESLDTVIAVQIFINKPVLDGRGDPRYSEGPYYWPGIDIIPGSGPSP